MRTKEETDKSYLMFVKDTNNGKITRVAFPEDVQVGTVNDPFELMITGRLSLSVKEYECQASIPVKIDRNCSIALIKPTLSTTSGRLYVTLPDNPRDGQLVFVKDAHGTSGVINIVVSASNNSLIDGSTTHIISTAYGSLSVCWLSDHWHAYGVYGSHVDRQLYGQFSDLTSQAATLANTAYYMSFNKTDTASGISIVNNTLGNPTRIKVTEDGLYQFTISPQLYKGSGSTTVSIWVSLNRENGGGNVANTNSDVEVGGGGSIRYVLPCIPMIIDMKANDYVEWVWSAEDTGVQILYTGARAAPARPANPSIILVCKRISPSAT